MIISHKYKFIFIKTKKTAGTSIEVYLSKLCGPDDVLTPAFPPIEGHEPRNYRGFFNPFPDFRHYGPGRWPRITKELAQCRRFYRHIPASLIRSRVSADTWNSYTKFCVDRDPFDKTLSHFHMLKARSNGELTLDEYFRRGRFCLNYRHYVDSRSEIIVDHILSYEDLDAELARLFASLGVPFSGRLVENAKVGERMDRRSYREVLSVQQIERIRQVFAEEIAIRDGRQ